MRFSLASSALCGAAVVSARALPSGKRGDLDGLGPFDLKNALPDVVHEIEDAIDDIQDFFESLVDLAPFEAGAMKKLTTPEEAKKGAEDVPGSKSDAKMPAPSPGEKADGAKQGCTSPAIRVEWRNMKEDDKRAYVKSVKCLMDAPSKGGFTGSKNRYEDLVSVHQQLKPKMHMVGQFLPWHRYYLHAFESLLRGECSYEGPMTWWDETKDAGNFANAPLFTTEYFGLAPLKTAEGNKGTCVTTGAFANTTLHIGPGAGYEDHCLSRAVDETMTANVDAEFVNNCNKHKKYADMERCQEMGPHGYGHNGMGAVMADVSPSPGDPVFYMHHSFIDRNWRVWQNADQADRLMQIGGFSTTTEPKTPLTLDFTLTSLQLVPDATIRDVMDTTADYLCYRYDY